MIGKQHAPNVRYEQQIAHAPTILPLVSMSLLFLHLFFTVLFRTVLWNVLVETLRLIWTANRTRTDRQTLVRIGCRTNSTETNNITVRLYVDLLLFFHLSFTVLFRTVLWIWCVLVWCSQRLRFGVHKNVLRIQLSVSVSLPIAMSNKQNECLSIFINKWNWIRHLNWKFLCLFSKFGCIFDILFIFASLENNIT